MFPNHIYIAIKGRNGEEIGKPSFYDPFEKDLKAAIKNMGYVETDWEDLYERPGAPYWIRVEKIPSVSDYKIKLLENRDD